MINYLIGDATEPQASGSKIIVHICNNIGGWGRGFVLALSKRWRDPEKMYRKWHKENAPVPFELGRVIFVFVSENIWVANLIGQQGIKADNGRPPIRYDAVRQGLHQVAEFALQEKATVHMPRIGCGLAGGNWQSIELIIQETLISKNIEVFVYDLPK